MSRNYKSVSLPVGLAEEIENYISNRGACYGYISLSDFVKDACRRRLDERSCGPSFGVRLPLAGE